MIEVKGKIFNIQKFCIGDGPGIRTTVFLKGCPLKCVWCHNPESQSIDNELLFRSDKCVGCLRCVEKCPNNCHKVLDLKHIYNRSNCLACGKCLGCEALEISGYIIDSDDVIKEVLKDKLYYDNSGGGLTLSGGEPLYQSEFCLEILKKAKENDLHICMETCGFANKDIIKKSAEFVDIYLFDIKETNVEKHKKFTGVDNKLILENLKTLDEMGKSIVLRCPIIPNCNDCDEHFEILGKLAESLNNILRIEVEPYHSFGEAKYSYLNREYILNNMASPKEKIVDLWISKIQENTKAKVIKG